MKKKTVEMTMKEDLKATKENVGGARIIKVLATKWRSRGHCRRRNIGCRWKGYNPDVMDIKL